MMKQKMAAVLAATLLTLAGTGFAAYAQPEGGGGPRPGKEMRHRPSVDERLARMTERLNLTEEQKARIKPIMEAQEKQMKAEFQATRAKIREVLTPEQQKKFDEMPARSGDCRKGPAKGMQPAPPPPPQQ